MPCRGRGHVPAFAAFVRIWSATSARNALIVGIEATGLQACAKVINMRGFAPAWARGGKRHRGDILWGAKVYKLPPDQFDLLLGEGPVSLRPMAHLTVRMFIAVHNDADGSEHRALFWSAKAAHEAQQRHRAASE